MSDETLQQIDQVVQGLERAGVATNRFTDNLSKANAEDKLSRDLFRKRASGAADALGALTGSWQDASSYFSTFVRGGILGAVVGSFVNIVKAGGKLADSYRDMAAHGHHFNGSMLELAISASEAGLPMAEFAEAVRSSSPVIKSLRSKDFPGLQREMRKNMVQHGNFAMSMQDLTKFTSAYWETSRRTGAFQHMSNEQLAKESVQLAGLTQALGDATGVAREQMVNLANAAMQSEMATSRIANMTASEAVAANRKLQQAVTTMASQVGDAGQFLSGALAETFGTGGLSEFTQQGQTLINAGMGHLASRLNTLSENLSPENSIMYMEDFRQEIGRNLPTLRALALSNSDGATAARELLKVHSQMKKMTQEDLRNRSKERDGITSLFLTFETLWNQITSSFRTGFFKGFRPLFKTVEDIQNSRLFKVLGEGMEKLGLAVGSLISKLLSAENVQRISDGFVWLGNKLEEFIRSDQLSVLATGISDVVKGFANLLVSIPWATIVPLIGAAFTVGIEIMKGFAWVMGKVLSVVGEFPGSILGVIGAFMAFKKIKSLIFGSNMMINARTVIVNGGLGGGLLGGRVRRMPRALRLARVAARRPGTAAKLIGGAAGRMAGRGALKAIPFIGGIAALGFAGAALARGDVVGAVGEVASGALATFLPGIGTAASLALTAGLAARDASKAASTATESMANASATASNTAASVSTTMAASQRAISDTQNQLGENQTLSAAEQRRRQEEEIRNNPLIQRLDRLVSEQRITNELMVRVAQSQHQDLSEQTKAIRRAGNNQG
jgi:hypothetical protein